MFGATAVTVTTLSGSSAAVSVQLNIWLVLLVLGTVTVWMPLSPDAIRLPPVSVTCTQTVRSADGGGMALTSKFSVVPPDPPPSSTACWPTGLRVRPSTLGRSTETTGTAAGSSSSVIVTVAVPMGVVPAVPVPEARSRLLLTARLPLPKPTVRDSDIPSSVVSGTAVTVSVATCTVSVP